MGIIRNIAMRTRGGLSREQFQTVQVDLISEKERQMLLERGYRRFGTGLFLWLPWAKDSAAKIEETINTETDFLLANGFIKAPLAQRHMEEK